jgi:formylglycine-generating enzyme required for sulfatase activity
LKFRINILLMVLLAANLAYGQGNRTKSDIVGASKKGINHHTKKLSEKGPIDIVFVKGGTFQMGSNENADEKPIHSVTVNSFSIGKYEVTQKQWRDIMGNTI